MKRRIIGVVAAVLLAAIGTAFLVIYVRSAEERALAGQETVEVLVVTGDVARGTPATDLAGLVTTERVPAKVRAEGGVSSLDQLDGQVASVDLVAGEQVVTSRFAEPAELETRRAIDIPEGLQGITISIAPQRALGGEIRPGDTVGFFASFSFDDEEIVTEDEEQLRRQISETTKIILHKLLVTNVQVEQLPQAAGEEDVERTGPALAPTGNLLITLAVDVAQAERIVFSAEYGTIWLSAQDEDTTEEGSRIRTPGNIYDD